MNRARVAALLGCLAIIAFSCAACGRDGPLEPPPGPGPAPTAQGAPADSALLGSPQNSAIKNGFDSHGNPVAAPVQQKSFILDPLLQ